MKRYFYVYVLTVAIGLASWPAFAAPYQYKFTGPVVAYLPLVDAASKCYISVTDKTGASSRSNYYHYVTSEQICDLAKSAFFLGNDVVLWGIANSKKESNNGVFALEIAKTNTNWWWSPDNW